MRSIIHQTCVYHCAITISHILHIWVVTLPYFGTELDPELQMYTVRDLAQESNLIPIDSSTPTQRAQFVTRRI